MSTKYAINGESNTGRKVGVLRVPPVHKVKKTKIPKLPSKKVMEGDGLLSFAVDLGKKLLTKDNIKTVSNLVCNKASDVLGTVISKSVGNGKMAGVPVDAPLPPLVYKPTPINPIKVSVKYHKGGCKDCGGTCGSGKSKKNKK